MVDVEHEQEIPVDGTGDEAERVPIFSQLTVLAVVLVLLLGAGVMPKIVGTLASDSTPSAVAQTLPPLEPLVVDERTLADVTLEADSSFLWDTASQRVLYQENADAQLPLASITKLMTALVANELLSGETTVTISEDAIAQDGASGLTEGERFTLRNLSDLVLLSSSNDGAYAVAETLGAEFDTEQPAAAFVALMNIRAEELGLTQTYFRNPTGLDITAEEAGAYGSARDVAFLMEYIVQNIPAILESTTDQRETIASESTNHTVRNTNQYVATIPGLIGSKTGYTDLAGGNLVVAFDSGVNHPIIAVVLGSSWQGRFNDINTLVKATTGALQ